jgi:hypothetical protein
MLLSLAVVMREQIRCPSGGSAVGSSEQMVYAAKRDGADCALNSLGVELETAILEEAEKRVPSGQVLRIASAMLPRESWVSSHARIQLDALPSEDLAQPIKRKVVAIYLGIST